MTLSRARRNSASSDAPTKAADDGAAGVLILDARSQASLLEAAITRCSMTRSRKSLSDSFAQRVGDKAELVFEDWAVQGDFHRARHTPDRVGVDYWFELPATPGSGAAGLDHDLPGTQGHVQVKGSASGASGCEVALSVCRRFANSDLPCWVLGVVLDDQFQYVQAHLIHVDEAQVGRILKRLRETDPADRDRLHTQSLYFGWSDENRLPEPACVEFPKAVRSGVGSTRRYAAKKARWRERAGYGDLPFEFKARPLVEADQVVGALLGDRRRIPIKVTKALETRFGIERPYEFAPGSRFEVEFEPPPRYSGEFATRSPVEDVSMLGQVVSSYEPSVVGRGAPHVVRFSGPCLTLEIHTARSRAVLVHHGLESPERPATLAALRNASDILVNLGRTDAEAEIRVDALNWQFPVRGAWTSLRFARNAFRAMAFRWAHIAATSAGVPAELLVSPQGLLDQFESLRWWGCSTDPRMTMFVEEPDTDLPTAPFVHFRPCWVDLGDRVLFQVLRQKWERSVDNPTEFKLTPTEMIRAKVLRPGELEEADISEWVRAEVENRDGDIDVWCGSEDLTERWQEFLEKRAAE